MKKEMGSTIHQVAINMPGTEIGTLYIFPPPPPPSFLDMIWFYHSGWSAVVGSQLNATSASWDQAILPLQLPK